MENGEGGILRIIDDAESLCDKFIKKVEAGRAGSVETYKECKELLEKIRILKEQ